jgi:hypothetical protein
MMPSLTSMNFSSSQHLLLYLKHLKAKKKNRKKLKEFLISTPSTETQSLTLS